MNIALITGSSGLIGAAAVRHFAAEGFLVLGIDNDMRAYFFGAEASTNWSRKQLESQIENYKHFITDIRDQAAIEKIFQTYGSDIKVVIHAAAQPSHDWAAKEPHTDFSVNANGTLVVLEATRKFSPRAVFIFTSTNKVYGDTPNELPLVEMETRWEIDRGHTFFSHGIDESMSIDASKHSLFGASKLAADILAQEYGRYFDMNVGVFRGGCLTGPGHSGAALHGFLAYLMKCAITGAHYTVHGYGGKQVRDNIHCDDLISCFWEFYKNPKKGEVYNMGGSRYSNCSMIEAIHSCEKLTGSKFNYSYSENNRSGDHIWYISDVRKFQGHYPQWKYRFGLNEILTQIRDECANRLSAEGRKAQNS